MDAETVFVEHKHVDSIESAEQWRRGASDYAAKLEAAIDACTTELEKIPAAVRAADEQAARRPLLKRMFRTAEQKRLQDVAPDIIGQRARAVDLREAVMQLLDDTPADTAERAQMVKDAKVQKKELQLQKREVVSTLRDIRDGARRSSAKAGTTLFGFAAERKYSAAQRRVIRAEKERSLASPEQLRKVIEHQIIDLERRIAWLQSL